MSDILCFIDDGYAEAGVIMAVPRLYPELTFRFRPMLQEERFAANRACESVKGYALTKVMASKIASHLLEWNVTGRQGRTRAHHRRKSTAA